jgi:3-hydroxyacyl-[acyl-carrier-protein] dehydratase
VHTGITRDIPHRPPFLFVDDIVSEADGALTARLRVRPEFDFFRGHYPGNPIMPGVLVSEAVFQAGCALLSRLQAREAAGAAAGAPAGVPVLARIENARFRSIVRPGDELSIDVRLRDRLSGFFFLAGTARVGTRKVMTVDFAVGLVPPDGAPAAAEG